jgi:hypothetical protein
MSKHDLQARPIYHGHHVITAAGPLPDDLQQALDAINGRTGGR